jgi:predicted ArsR family transcriptional regulator
MSGPNLFDWEGRYPKAPGYKERTTSQEAAEAIKPAARMLRDRVLSSLARIGPRTADEMAASLGEDILSIRPRFTELRRLGLIEKTGERRPNKSGADANVWRIWADAAVAA